MRRHGCCRWDLGCLREVFSPSSSIPVCTPLLAKGAHLRREPSQRREDCQEHGVIERVGDAGSQRGSSMVEPLTMSFGPNASLPAPPAAARAKATAGGAWGRAEKAPALSTWGTEGTVAAARGCPPLALAALPTCVAWWEGVTPMIAPGSHALGIPVASRSRVSSRAGTEGGVGLYCASWGSTGATEG